MKMLLMNLTNDSLQELTKCNLEIHGMKMYHLRYLFEREKTAMLNVCQKRAKQKKFKKLYVQIAQFTEEKVNCILQEYFNLCLLVYRIKSTVNYVWSSSYDIEDVIDLF